MQPCARVGAVGKLAATGRPAIAARIFPDKMPAIPSQETFPPHRGRAIRLTLPGPDGWRAGKLPIGKVSARADGGGSLVPTFLSCRSLFTRAPRTRGLLLQFEGLLLSLPTDFATGAKPRYPRPLPALRRDEMRSSTFASFLAFAVAVSAQDTAGRFACGTNGAADQSKCTLVAMEASQLCAPTPEVLGLVNGRFKGNGKTVP